MTKEQSTWNTHRKEEKRNDNENQRANNGRNKKESILK
jgi:hypothetical protein